MSDLIFRFDTTARHTNVAPADPDEAIRRLEAGNRSFANLVFPNREKPVQKQVILFDADDLGLMREDGSMPIQSPFAAILGCSDARVPTELVLGQAYNDLFVIRVAGNVPGPECLGSLDYALAQLGASIKLVVVLGHSVCGAVTAAVDVFLNPTRYLDVASTHPLRAIVDRILAAAKIAATSLEEVHGRSKLNGSGYRDALIEVAVPINAAITAATLNHELQSQLTSDCRVVFGVYNLISRRLAVPLEDEGRQAISLAPPPKDSQALHRLGLKFADTDSVRAMLAMTH